ncbi:MarR family winged helix-turn-helix transcriptional regulator [Streptomyces sp. NPDC059009]|uniref:MarR family winged helix-turn-helix transcriptional regulator n=1 Tax=Streptomyces sp. NPDC059009 TaxID=3346694 RepID=UPI003692E3C8
MERRTDRIDDVVRAWRRELPDAVGPTTELASRIMLLSTALDDVTTRELNKLKLTVAEYHTLVALRRAGNPFRMRPSQIVNELPITSGGTSKILKQLSVRGLVVRRPDEWDGRVTWVQLTDAGLTFSEEAVRNTSAAQQELFRRLAPETAEHATHALRELSVSVADRLPV